jgi:pilus assembly protein CpaB
MTRRRRAAALLGLALLLGVLAASDVAGREAALRRQLGPTVRVVVVRAPLRAGERISRAALAVREVPERYAPAGALREPEAAVGRRAAVAIAPGTDLEDALLAVPRAGAEPPGPVLRRGERALELVAVGAADAVVAGARVRPAPRAWPWPTSKCSAPARPRPPTGPTTPPDCRACSQRCA